MPERKDMTDLEKKLDYQFRDQSLLRTALTLYRSGEEEELEIPSRPAPDRAFAVAIAALIILNIGLGLLGGPILQIIEHGILTFA